MITSKTIDLDMRFPHPLIQGENGEGTPVFGFSHKDMFIFDPEKSDCGRFDVDPKATYGLSPEESAWLKNLNAAIHEITSQALHSLATATIQKMGMDWRTELYSSGLELMKEPTASITMKTVAAHFEYQMRENGLMDFAEPRPDSAAPRA